MRLVTERKKLTEFKYVKTCSVFVLGAFWAVRGGAKIQFDFKKIFRKTPKILGKNFQNLLRYEKKCHRGRGQYVKSNNIKTTLK